MDTLLSTLNSSQRAAVEYIDGAELVIAGAGSGKTRVLTYKIAYMLSMGLKPWSILALTFTNKAAREMKERIGSLVGPDAAHYLNMGTFHSVFLRILRAESEVIGLKRNFTIFDDADTKSLVNSIVKELKLDDKCYKPSNVLSRIGMAKNNLITPEAYAADGSLLERDHRSKMPKLCDIYRLYVQRCRIANAVDFDDMLMYTYMLFRNHPEVCKKYADRFKYILVDEYQDTNYAQQCILTLLTRNQNNKICVVGDDAQSIYAFRGANIDNILNFQNIYSDSKLFKLEQNYRSTQNIVNAANCLISHNQRQIQKTVYSENPQGDKVKVNVTYSDREEASVVCNEIKRLHRREGVEYGDCAILYRTNAQSRLFEDELRRENIPYRIYGGVSFYQRKEIKDIIAYFRMVANPDDEEALKRIINYPKRGIGATSVDKLIAASRQYNVSLWRVIDNPKAYVEGLSSATAKRIVAFHDMMQVYIDSSTTTDVYILGKRIIEETGLSQEIFADGSVDAKEQRDNVEEFISGLHDFVDSKREEDYGDEVYISNFLQEVALVTDADKNNNDENSANRVSLMTIHASKGLEFNTVFIVGVEENIFPSPRACEFPRELEEERRLFYVAITRAEKHCFISCAKSRYQYGNMLFNEPSRFLRELDRNVVDVNGKLTTNRAEYEDNMFSSPYNRSMPTTRDPQRFRKIEPARVKSFTSRNPEYTQSGTRYPQASSSAASASPASAWQASPSAPQRLAVGMTIEHQRFGMGKVVKVEGYGENQKATVDFENAGTKTLLLKFARYNIK